MALIPSRQLHPAATLFDSFQSSPKLNSFKLFRYSSSIHFENYTFCATGNWVSYGSLCGRSPFRNSSFVRMKKPIFQYCPKKNFCCDSWVRKWNEPQKNRPKPPRAVLDYRSSENGQASGLDFENSDSDGDAENGSGVKRGGSGSTMERIVEKLKKFGYVDNGIEDKDKTRARVLEKGSVEDIFHVEEGMLPNTRGGFSPESPLGIGSFGGDEEVRFPWEKPREKEEGARNSVRRKTIASLAELTLPESELRRLRNLTFQKKHKTRIGGGGVTQAVVDMIHERWKTSEIVRLKFEGVAALNMKRMHEILERKTGGLVIWRSGNSVSLYRGVSYEIPSVQVTERIYKKSNTSKFLPTPPNESVEKPSEFASNTEMNAPLETLETTNDQRKKESLPEVKYEDEVDKLLDSLGPRYTDWPGCDPLPVDADMLPATIRGYQPPFRVLPYGVKPTLGLKQATSLRRVARGLPPHFALGRNRQLQGLAAAIVKLWEKSSIAKVALKRGVQLTTSERMAEEIKKLTGGTLLSRNKDFLVFYRGKNFLSPDVAQALLEREKMVKTLQDDEEQARLRASSLIVPTISTSEQSGEAGTLGETLDADAKWGKTLDDHHEAKVMREIEQQRHAKLVRKLEQKLAFAERKLARAERALMKVEQFLTPSEHQADPESITDEERFMFRKLGLRMKAFLLLGRRGVFDGTIENMHLHWKYRELIKIIVKAKTFEQVKKVALALEAESGGVLVSVDKVSKGFAIVVFRGKDYKRPSMLRPKNLLTKRRALARSIELQRRECLSHHISALQYKVEKIRSEIEKMETVKDEGDEALYDRLDSTYPTDDEEDTKVGDGDEEDDEAYLGTYNSENDSEDEDDNLEFSTKSEADHNSH